MQTLPDWAGLWKELAGLNDRWYETGETQGDHWQKKSRSFSDNVQKRWARPDSSRDFFISRLRADHGATLLDIGAGSGAWSALAAPYLVSVTAIERSPAMLAVMGENLAEAGISNVRILEGTWPEVEVESHDYSLCSHAMYGAPDLPRYLRKMVAVTRRMCFMLIRAPKMDGLMAEFARLALGQPHDSPNFVIAYNILIEMGIYANVLCEDGGCSRNWRHASLAEALAEVKHRLGLHDNPAYDAIIYRRLEQELRLEDGEFVWPEGVRSMLVYWEVG